MEWGKKCRHLSGCCFSGSRKPETEKQCKRTLMVTGLYGTIFSRFFSIILSSFCWLFKYFFFSIHYSPYFASYLSSCRLYCLYIYISIYWVHLKLLIYRKYAVRCLICLTYSYFSFLFSSINNNNNV